MKTWREIGEAIERGEYPRRQELVAAAKGGDPVLGYLIRILAEKGTRGRPKKEDRRLKEDDYYLLRDVGKHYRITKSQKKAFAAVGLERGNLHADTIERYYRAARSRNVLIVEDIELLQKKGHEADFWIGLTMEPYRDLSANLAKSLIPLDRLRDPLGVFKNNLERPFRGIRFPWEK